MRRIRKRIAPPQQIRYPRRLVSLVPMTVGQVIHHLPVANPTLLVDLPEDDAPLARGPQPVMAGRMEHLLLRQIATADYRLAELAVHRQAAHP